MYPSFEGMCKRRHKAEDKKLILMFHKTRYLQRMTETIVRFEETIQIVQFFQGPYCKEITKKA